MTGMKGTERRVLVVEDEPDLTELLAFNLQAGGYKVETAGGVFQVREDTVHHERRRRDFALPGRAGQTCEAHFYALATFVNQY